MKQNIFALKGNLLYTKKIGEISSQDQAFLICENDSVLGVFDELPERYAQIEVRDFGDKLIIPGLVDMHLHAPQYSFRGLGMDLELLDWLERNTFPEEAKYADPFYAEKAYNIFVEDLVYSETTRVGLFATLHNEATKILMDKLEESGIRGYVGKVNMDRNSPDQLVERSAQQALQDTEEWIQYAQAQYQNIKPILTPRFTPSCSDELMEGLGELKKRYALPLQSHLSENASEVVWVKELCPTCDSYAQSYDRFGLLENSIMAHCVYLEEEEIDLLKERGTYVAHCPQSNTNLSSGIAPIRKYIQRGLNIGLGTDMAGGHSLSMFRAIADAVQVSKLYWRLVNQSCKALTVSEAFFLATKGGGSFFGKVGSFEKGYDFDALVLDDSGIRHPQTLSSIERLERYIYLANKGNITAKYVGGKAIFA